MTSASETRFVATSAKIARTISLELMTCKMNITSMDEHSDRSQGHEADGSISSGRNSGIVR